MFDTAIPKCKCAELGDLAVVAMGDPDGLDEQIFDTIERIKRHGGRQWWLNISRCAECNQAWMIAQEERIHDNYYFRRIDSETLDAILDRDVWPDEFMRFEDVIRLGPDNSKVCHFVDPDCLIDTVKELIEDRDDMSADDLSYLLCVSSRTARNLMNRARSTPWATLRPFA